MVLVVIMIITTIRGNVMKKAETNKVKIFHRLESFHFCSIISITVFFLLFFLLSPLLSLV
jgi:hypothetical protein